MMIKCKMGLTGIEPHSVTECKDSNLQQSPESGAAESGAFGSDLCQIDGQLQEIVKAWPALSPAVRLQILELTQQGD